MNKNNGKKTILAVDDDPTYGDLYRAILEPKGYNVQWAKNPGEGYSFCLKYKPDLIILDVMMPEEGGFFDGFDLLKRLRLEGPCMKTPIIMVSSIGGADDIRHGRESGADGYMPKQNMIPSKLLAEIEKQLG